MALFKRICHYNTFKFEGIWVSETKHQQQSQPEVIYETQDVSI